MDLRFFYVFLLTVYILSLTGKRLRNIFRFQVPDYVYRNIHLRVHKEHHGLLRYKLLH